MTEALFLAEFEDPQVGDEITLAGDEGRHAVAVRRIAVGETILLADGAGAAVRGPVVSTDKASLVMRVEDVLSTPAPRLRFIAAQALAKGDRAELAVEVLTELGIDEVVPWQASRSIVKWVPDRAERHLARWRSVAREATKQSRRFKVPVVTVPMSTRELALRVPETALTLVLHEGAERALTSVTLPDAGDVMLVVGPEGGVAPDELEALVEAGGVAVKLSDGVLRTSTAGVVALAQLQAIEQLTAR